MGEQENHEQYSLCSDHPVVNPAKTKEAFNSPRGQKEVLDDITVIGFIP